MMLDEWIIGEWYLAVRCRNCGIQFAFQRDDETPESAYFTNSNEIVLTCLACCYPLPYTGEQIERVHHTFANHWAHNNVTTLYAFRPSRTRDPQTVKRGKLA